MVEPWGSPLAGAISGRRGGSSLLLLRGDVGQQLLGEEGLLLGRSRYGHQRGAGTRPHLDGPRPGVVEGGPGGAGWSALGPRGAGSLLWLRPLGALAGSAHAVAVDATAASAATVRRLGAGQVAPPEPEAACCC